MPLKSSCTNSRKKRNALKQQRNGKNRSEKIATEAKRSENQTFPGNWIVCVLLLSFFRNILMLEKSQAIDSQ